MQWKYKVLRLAALASVALAGAATIAFLELPTETPISFGTTPASVSGAAFA